MAEVIIEEQIFEYKLSRDELMCLIEIYVSVGNKINEQKKLYK